MLPMITKSLKSRVIKFYIVWFKTEINNLVFPWFGELTVSSWFCKINSLVFFGYNLVNISKNFGQNMVTSNFYEFFIYCAPSRVQRPSRRNSFLFFLSRRTLLEEILTEIDGNWTLHRKNASSIRDAWIQGMINHWRCTAAWMHHDL